jgi:enoyl-CoA hydratase/carnithine racemase
LAKFEEYAEKYPNIRMERRDGILQITFHTNGGSLQWGEGPHGDFPKAYADIATDPENRVVIMTGTGDDFSGPRASNGAHRRWSNQDFDVIYNDGRRLLMNLLDIPVPTISAINGPAWRHGEMPLLCDMVLASETVQFQDSGHFGGGLVPGDGMHIVMPLLMGMNRGRYFLFTGQTLNANEAKELGLVNEVLPKEDLLPRAYELAEMLIARPRLLVNYTRAAVTQIIKKQMLDLLGYGLVLEGLAQMDE